MLISLLGLVAPLIMAYVAFGLIRDVVREKMDDESIALEEERQATRRGMLNRILDCIIAGMGAYNRGPLDKVTSPYSRLVSLCLHSPKGAKEPKRIANPVIERVETI